MTLLPIKHPSIFQANNFDLAEENSLEIASSDNENRIEVVHDGVGLQFDEEKAVRILGAEAVEIEVYLHDGNANGRAWGCDLTYDYVKINGDYRS